MAGYYDNDITSARLDKQSEQDKKSVVYSTEKIDRIIDDMHKGYAVDLTPFYRGNPERRESNITFEYTEEELAELEKCANDCYYFVSHYVKFLNNKGRTIVQLRDYQEEYLKLMSEECYDPDIEDYCPVNKNIILLAARQTGKSSTVAAFFCWKLCFSTEKNFAIVANKLDTSKQIIKLVQDMFDGLPFYMKPGVTALMKQSITVENGCSLKCVATSATALTGSTINLLYVDECAHINPSIMYEVWASVYPTLSSFNNSQVIVTSTPKGKNNLFFDLYSNAMTGKNNFKVVRVDWWRVPGHDQEWYDNEVKALGEALCAREYCLQFEGAGSQLLRGSDFRYIDRVSTEYVQHDIACMPFNIQGCLWWHPKFDISGLANRRFLFSVDTSEGDAKGKAGQEEPDFNVINIFECELMNPVQVLANRMGIGAIEMKDIFRFKQVGVYIDNNSDEEQAATALSHLVFDLFKSGAGLIDNCRVLVEMNFNGKNFINVFRKHRNFYDGVILKTFHSQPVPGEKSVRKYGYKTTHGSRGKNYWCELGAKMIMQRQIIVTHKSGNMNYSTYGQLENFGKSDKKNKYEGLGVHDDLSFSTLAVSHVTDIPDFWVWLEEFLDGKKEVARALKLCELMKKLVDEADGSLSDEEFKGMYSGFGVSGSGAGSAPAYAGGVTSQVYPGFQQPGFMQGFMQNQRRFMAPAAPWRR